ncbi:MAG TPA: SdrD B-like domain-containing protein, partial [Thermoflexales bacterium]|nr:SdrD B-like domain-containing protein [Thermoflexales bacterium]
MTIGGSVWKDVNGNGIQDAGEPGLSGVTVGLVDASGNPVMCTDAGVTGYYLDAFTAQVPNGSDGTLYWDYNTRWVGGYETIWGWGNPGFGHYIGAYAGMSTTRAIDLSVFGSSPVLNFDVKPVYGSTVVMRADISVDNGLTYAPLMTGTASGSAKTFTVTMPLTTTVSTAMLRFYVVSASDTPVFDNVKVSGQLLVPQTAVTDASGAYTFSDTDCVNAGSTYGFVVAENQSALTGYVLSPQNAGGVTSNDATLDNTDSDAVNGVISGTLYAVIGGAVAPASGTNYSYDFGFTPVLPALVIYKSLVGGSSSGAFGVTVNGPNGYVSQGAVAAGSSLALINLQPGTYTVTESSLPTAPSGYYWLPATYSTSGGAVQLGYGDVQTVTVKNALATPGPGNSLTLTKTVMGSTNSGPYNVTITGPNGYVNNTTIMSGVNTISGLPAGVLTVTETSPGTGWTTTYMVGNTSNSTSAVITNGNQITAATVAPGVITGTVYADYNETGMKGTYDYGVAGVTVTAYDRYGNAVGSTTTNMSGTYSLTPSAAGPWRLEFTNLPAGYEPSRVYTGTQNGTSTQFINSVPSGNNNFAINRPCDYCQANPPILQVVKMMNGYGTLSAIQKEAFSFAGQYNTGSTLATGNQVGNLWGLAWSPTNQTIYAGATVQADGLMGPGGAGAIYAVSPTGSPAPTVFATIPNIGDTSYSTSVGTTGIGDVDINADGSMLYTVNLNDKQLYAIPTANPSAMQAYPIPNDCIGGTPRPWATKVYNGKVYVGVVCDAALSQLTQDLREYVYEFDPATGTWTTVVDRAPATRWNYWIDTYGGAQPLIVDIEFDESGRIILNESSRGNMMWNNGGYMGLGDFVRLCPSGTGTWVDCAGTTSDAVGLTLIGGMAYVNGSGDFVIGVADPAPPGGANGMGGAQLYDAYTAANQGYYFAFTGGAGGRYGKSASVGDLELMCDPAPIEIGNRVWYDVNNNGVQDPGEQPISGVVVSLVTISGTITTTTNVNGNYYFTREATSGAYATSLRPNTPYTIYINPAQAALSGYTLTVPNAQAVDNSSPTSNDAILDTRDSDAGTVGGIPTIYYTTGTAGQNNHGLDFGFVKPVTGAASVQNMYVLTPGISVVKYTNGNDADVGSGPMLVVGSTVTWTYVIRNTGNVTLTNVALTDDKVALSNASECSPASALSSFAPGAVMVCTKTGVATAGQYVNVATVTGVSVVSPFQTVNDTNPSAYYGVTPITNANSLVLTKTVVGSTNSGPYSVTITGPNGYVTNTTITSGTNTIAGLPAGVYTITETSPGAGWVTTYTVGGANTITSAVLSLGGVITAAAVAPGLITGTVYADYNEMGMKGAYDYGVAGVTVTAYDQYGNAVGSTTTNMSGTYSLTPSAAGPWRLEFTNLPAGYEPSRVYTGTQNGTSTQFIN